MCFRCCYFNTLRPRQNGRHFAHDVFKCIFFNENVWIALMISLKFVLNVPINNIPALVQIMAWRRSGDKPLSEPIMVSILTHICVTRPQWVKIYRDMWCLITSLLAAGRPRGLCICEDGFDIQLKCLIKYAQRVILAIFYFIKLIRLLMWYIRF